MSQNAVEATKKASDNDDNVRGSVEPTRRFTSGELFGSDTEIVISHDGSVYRLRITRQGKLILNK